KVAEDVGDDDDFNSGAGFSATNYVIVTAGTKEQQQLAQNEEAYREYLEEEATAEKERARAEKEYEEEMKKEEAHNELF
nr:hypothetical protein [Tanacetum cinerariifolium]